MLLTGTKTAWGRTSRGAQRSVRNLQSLSEGKSSICTRHPASAPHLSLGAAPLTGAGCCEEVMLPSCLLLILRLPGTGTLTTSHSGSFSWLILCVWQYHFSLAKNKKCSLDDHGREIADLRIECKLTYFFHLLYWVQPSLHSLLLISFFFFNIPS